MTAELTKRQKQVFQFIADYIERHAYGPTVREIGEKFDISSPNGVVGHLRALERKQMIVRQANKSRTIELSPEYQSETKGLPIAGRVAAVVRVGCWHRGCSRFS